MFPLAQIRKAVTAGLAALVAGFGAALADGGLTGSESLIAVGLGLTAAAATWAVPNAPAFDPAAEAGEVG